MLESFVSLGQGLAIAAQPMNLVFALIGVLLGTAYGLVGTASVLGDAGLVPAVPGVRLVLIVLTAGLAGLLASVLPGRRAARTPPVAAMAAT